MMCRDCGVVPAGPRRPSGSGPAPSRCETCRRVARSAQSKAARARHPETARDYAKRQAVERRTSGLARPRGIRGIGLCGECGSSFEVTDERSTYCSKPCLYAGSAKVRRARAAEAAKMAWVGTSCRVWVNTCTECQSPFVARRKSTRCPGRCTRDPSLSRARAKYRETYQRDLTPRVCDQCGISFIHGRQGPARFCSQKCVQSTETYKDGRRRHAHLRRVRLASGGVSRDRVYRQRIYERDGWRCQLCQRPVRRDVAPMHDMAPTLDHIIPVSAGGLHEPLNVQTAHFLCNSKRGATGPAQLRLLA